MVVSLANPFVFKKVADPIAVALGSGNYTENKQPQTFDNKFQCEFDILNKTTQTVPQVINLYQFQIQVICQEGRSLSQFTSSGISFVSKTLRETIDGRDFYTFIFESTAAGLQQFQIVEQDGGTIVEIYQTAVFEVLDLSDTEMTEHGYYKIEYSNDDNKYLYDYRSRYYNKAFFQGRLYEYEGKIKTNIFDNDEETINQKTTVQRTLKFEVGKLNPKTAELLSIILSHEFIFINGDQFTMEDKPEITYYSNYTELSVVLTQNNVIGLNTFGFIYPDIDCPTVENCYIMINPNPVSYIPAASGNTENLNEFIIASDGTHWFIDKDGRALHFEMFPEFKEEIPHLTGTNFVTPSYLPSGDYDHTLTVILNGSVLKYSGATATDKLRFGVSGGNIYFARTIRSTDQIVVYGIRK